MVYVLFVVVVVVFVFSWAAIILQRVTTVQEWTMLIRHLGFQHGTDSTFCGLSGRYSRCYAQWGEKITTRSGHTTGTGEGRSKLPVMAQMRSFWRIDLG